jgi:hypothetical protein
MPTSRRCKIKGRRICSATLECSGKLSNRNRRALGVVHKDPSGEPSDRLDRHIRNHRLDTRTRNRSKAWPAPLLQQGPVRARPHPNPSHRRARANHHAIRHPSGRQRPGPPPLKVTPQPSARQPKFSRISWLLLLASHPFNNWINASQVPASGSESGIGAVSPSISSAGYCCSAVVCFGNFGWPRPFF